MTEPKAKAEAEGQVGAPPPAPAPATEPKTCVVCGQQSHRETWDKKVGEHVACDHHSDEEIKNAISKSKKAPEAEGQPDSSKEPKAESNDKPPSHSSKSSHESKK